MRWRGWVTACALGACGCGSSSAPSRPADGARAASSSSASIDAGRAAAAADPHAARAALHKGWEASRRGDDAAALAAFQDAVAAAPDDARALTELSWAAVLRGQLDLSEHSARHALEVATDPKLRAMALYNLGRVAEARGDRAGAASDYDQSLALRPNRAVERRRKQLPDAAVASAVAPVPAPRTTGDAPVALAGPFADLAGFCADLDLPVTEHGDSGDDPTLEDDVWCAPEGEPVAGAPSHPAPFDRIAILRHAETAEEVTLDLALHATKGWYVIADVGAIDGVTAGAALAFTARNRAFTCTVAHGAASCLAHGGFP